MYIHIYIIYIHTSVHICIRMHGMELQNNTRSTIIFSALARVSACGRVRHFFTSTLRKSFALHFRDNPCQTGLRSPLPFSLEITHVKSAYGSPLPFILEIPQVKSVYGNNYNQSKNMFTHSASTVILNKLQFPTKKKRGR